MIGRPLAHCEAGATRSNEQSTVAHRHHSTPRTDLVNGYPRIAGAAGASNARPEALTSCHDWILPDDGACAPSGRCPMR